MEPCIPQLKTAPAQIAPDHRLGRFCCAGSFYKLWDCSAQSEARNALLRLLADVGEDAAAHMQNPAVHKTGGFRGQKNSRALQTVGRTPPPRRRLADDERIKRMAAAVRLTYRKGAVCGVAMYPGPMPLPRMPESYCMSMLVRRGAG